MKNLKRLLALACSVAAVFRANAQVPDPNHTVVRFDVFAAGTNFGQLDIELFDQEKPETVKNFLLYVYSGAYSNLVLHRLVPGFVVQAGHVRIEDPASAETFASYVTSPNFGRIRNEYGVGPELTNVFGTIAMARVGGQTNSAATDWFINLTNNPSLDIADGGFTVFGRVVNAMDDRSGTNLLTYFNTLSSGNGVRSASTTNPVESFSNLLVTTNRAEPPLYSDLFTVQATVIQGGKPHDAVAPAIAVTQPSEEFFVTTNSTLTISGTASDNQEVVRVLYDFGSGKSLVASGTTNWTADLTLNYGTNRFSVHSVDEFGNVSTTLERVIVFRTPPPASNHTVVRFDIFAAGTNFGKLDIELFDQEKPETVKNFLLYVYSGAYSNLVLHRLVPGFVLQGGHVRIDDPASTDVFSSYPVRSDFGKITNEYGVGPELANDFATIAMARVPGQTNSADTDWFINLTNNPFLNTNDGGFTVFGRVVNEMDERSGILLLNYLNTFTGSQIRSVSIADPAESLSSLPVATNRAGAPLYADLLTIQTSFVQGGLPKDEVAPTITVTQPAADSITTTNSRITITGTAADNQEVALVLYDTDAEKSLIVNGKTSWSVELPLDFGTNRFSFRSVDYFGNVSAIVERVIVREERPADPAHTVVRFEITTNGVPFGRLDVELYDDVKPETVRNFLMYVYSGAYSNLIVQDVQPNSILQAGSVHPDGTNGFKRFIYTPVVNFGMTSAEFLTGGHYERNEFGTIATARVPGANSASNAWHINLGNNPSFDTDPGGSTVFGRVVNTTDDRSGINLLRFFNTLQNGVHLRAVSQFAELGALQVPVTAYRFSELPYAADMYLIRASIIQGGTVRDNIAPIVQINDPADTSVIVTTNETERISGTAVDNQQIVRVIYDTPGGVAFPVDGKENWSKEIALAPGTNRVTVRAVDQFGNVGMAERTFFRSRLQTLAFHIEGKGKVTGIANGQTFLVGVNYTFVAKPPPQQYFLGWKGNAETSISETDRTLTFSMPDGLTNLVAVFSRTFLGLTNGAYRGLFYPSTNGPPRSAGAISLNLSANGFYSGRLAPIGANYGIRHKFQGPTDVIRDSSGFLELNMTLYGDETIQGYYREGATFFSDLGLAHVRKFTAANPTPAAGTYSFLISPTTVVHGYGFGTATIDPRGKIKMTGTLADGTAIKQNSVLLSGDSWAFYASAKAGRKAILGYTSLDSNGWFGVNARWFDTTFPGNTNQVARLDGSPYTPPSQGRLFNWTNGVMSLSGGGLQAAIFANVVLNDDGSFTISSNPNNIQLNIPDAKGLISGSFTHPVTSALTPLKGAVLQSSNMAAGFFSGGGTSGAFVIRGN